MFAQEGLSGDVHLSQNRFFKIAIVVSCVVSIVMAYLGYGAWSLVFQQIVFNFLQTVMLWILDKWKPTVEFSWVHFQEIFSFGSKRKQLGSRVK